MILVPYTFPVDLNPCRGMSGPMTDASVFELVPAQAKKHKLLAFSLGHSGPNRGLGRLKPWLSSAGWPRGVKSFQNRVTAEHSTWCQGNPEGSWDRARVWGRASYREKGPLLHSPFCHWLFGFGAWPPSATCSVSWSKPLCLMMIHTHTQPFHCWSQSLWVFPFCRGLPICPLPMSLQKTLRCLPVCLLAVSEGNHNFPGPFLGWGLPWRVDAQVREGYRTTWKGSLDTLLSFVISAPTLDLEQVSSDRGHSDWGTPSPYNSFRGWTLETLWQPCPRGSTCTKLEKSQSNNQGTF